MANKQLTKDRAKALKKLGLISYDLRKPLSTNERRRVSKLAKRFDDVIKNRDQYLKVVAENQNQYRKALQSNVTGYDKNLFVSKKGYTKAKIKGDEIILTKKLSTGETKKERILLVNRRDMLGQLKKYSQKGVLKDGEYLMVRIGTHSPFGLSVDYEQLNNYVTNWRTDDLKDMDRGHYHGGKSRAELEETRDNLITQMYIVSYDMAQLKLIHKEKLLNMKGAKKWIGKKSRR